MLGHLLLNLDFGLTAAENLQVICAVFAMTALYVLVFLFNLDTK
jgi:hypothetical protein